MCGRCTTVVVLLILYCLYIVLQVQCTHLWIAQPIQCYPPVGGGAKVELQPGANTPKTLVLSRFIRPSQPFSHQSLHKLYQNCITNRYRKHGFLSRFPHIVINSDEGITRNVNKVKLLWLWKFAQVFVNKYSTRLDMGKGLTWLVWLLYNAMVNGT